MNKILNPDQVVRIRRYKVSRAREELQGLLADVNTARDALSGVLAALDLDPAFAHVDYIDGPISDAASEIRKTLDAVGALRAFMAERGKR